MRNVAAGLIALFLASFCLNVSAGFWSDLYGERASGLDEPLSGNYGLARESKR